MKENWSKLVPEDDLSAWGIAPVRMTIPKKPKPSIKYFVRRVRNAIGHSVPDIKVAPGAAFETITEDVTITFHDKNQNDRTDTFEAEITLKDSFTMTHKLHEIVQADVAKRHRVTPPPPTE